MTTVTYSMTDANGATQFETVTFATRELADIWIAMMRRVYGAAFNA